MYRQTRNPITRRCILKVNKIPKNTTLLKCSNNTKYRSPITGRCILKDEFRGINKRSPRSKKSNIKPKSKKFSKTKTKINKSTSFKSTRRKGTPIDIVIALVNKWLTNQTFWTPERLSKKFPVSVATALSIINQEKKYM
jgi:hypothetical protein